MNVASRFLTENFWVMRRSGEGGAGEESTYRTLGQFSRHDIDVVRNFSFQLWYYFSRTLLSSS